MELMDQIKRFAEFIELHLHAELLEKARKGENFLTIDFNELSKFDPTLADFLLDQPEEVIKAAEVSVKEFDLPGKAKNFRVRFSNLPYTQKIMIRDIRSKHLGKFLFTDGVVRQKSDVRPQVTAAKFECPSCGNMISVLQLDTKFREPTRCGCGRKGKFRLVSKELVDAQRIVLEETPEDLEGGEQPKRIDIFLKADLVSPLSDKKTNPGSRIIINGILKEVPIILRTGGQSIRFDLFIEANHIYAVEEGFGDIEITKEEEEQIKELATDPKIHKMVFNSIAPSIYGHERIKEAIFLQLVGGVRKVRDDGVITRGDMHILLIGDPGAGKCISGDSKIMLENGEITTIKSFNENNVSSNVGIRTYSERKVLSINEKGLNFASQPVKFWRRKAPKKMLKITTNTGNELVVTKDHPLFTTKNGLIFAKEAYEYKKGEYISLPSKIDVRGAIQPVSKEVAPSKSNNKVKYKIKELFDADFARLFGYLVGDGYVRLRKTTGIISFTNSNKGLLNDFEILVKKVFNLKASKRKKRNSSSYEYYVSSIELVRILEKMDPNLVKGSENMAISKIITKSPKYIIKEFIRSLFDCEGYINKKKREIEFSSKSKELIFDLKYILLRFGIISQISSALKCATNTKNKTKRLYYRLRISGEDIIRFYKEIGFVSKEKQKRLELWIKSKKKLNTNLDIVPNLKILLKTLRNKYNLSQFSFPVTRSTYQHYEKGDRFPSYEKLKAICNRYTKLDSKDYLIEILKQISNADIFWDKIKRVEEIDFNEDYVYDLEIEVVHNFVANGVMVHNSQLLKRVTNIAPKGRYVSGKGASGAGLTAAVVRDEFLKGWALEAGALVLANKGFCMIDELDKMTKEDRSAMHEALEQQTVTISKANIQATLRAETTVLAAANPKFGRFDPYDIVAKQIDLPPTLINRFDLIFPIKDLPDPQNDEKMAKFILDLHKNTSSEKAEIETKLLRKYIGYARTRVFPKLTDMAMDEIKEYYITMRGSGSTEESIVKTIPISARQLEALVRLSEANARLRLSDKVTKKDARKAIELLDYCLKQVGLDRETGKIDIDRITTGITATQRSNITLIKEVISDLENKLGKTIPIDDVVRDAAEKGINADKVDEAIERLKRSGDLFEPRRGFIQRI